KAQIPKTALIQMFRTEPANSRAIDVYERKARVLDHSQHIHRGDADSRQRLGNGRILNARDDAIAAPVLQPARHTLLKAARLVINRPRPLLADVTGDAAQNV